MNRSATPLVSGWRRKAKLGDMPRKAIWSASSSPSQDRTSSEALAIQCLKAAHPETEIRVVRKPGGTGSKNSIIPTIERQVERIREKVEAQREEEREAVQLIAEAYPLPPGQALVSRRLKASQGAASGDVGRTLSLFGFG